MKRTGLIQNIIIICRLLLTRLPLLPWLIFAVDPCRICSCYHLGVCWCPFCLSLTIPASVLLLGIGSRVVTSTSILLGLLPNFLFSISIFVCDFHQSAE